MEVAGLPFAVCSGATADRAANEAPRVHQNLALFRGKGKVGRELVLARHVHSGVSPRRRKGLSRPAQLAKGDGQERSRRVTHQTEYGLESRIEESRVHRHAALAGLKGSQARQHGAFRGGLSPNPDPLKRLEARSILEA